MISIWYTSNYSILLVVNLFHWSKENLYEEGKKNDKKDKNKVIIVTEENPTEFIKVKVNGTLNDVFATNYMIQLIWKFNW